MDTATQETIDNLSSENAFLRYEVDRLQRKNDNQSITIGEFQEGLGKFVDAPIGKVAYFSDAEKKLNQLKADVDRLERSLNSRNQDLETLAKENHQLKEENETLRAYRNTL